MRLKIWLDHLRVPVLKQVLVNRKMGSSQFTLSISWASFVLFVEKFISIAFE